MDDHDQQFCLRWNNHQSTIISVFGTLKENEALVDCTLAAEGKFLKAHKVVLSACSPYFATLLQEQYDKHPIFILKDVKYQELCAMMDYMYHGEVNISQDQLAALLKAAESLQIKGLSDNRSAGGSTVPKQEHHRASMPPTPKLSGGYTLEQTKRARIALGPGSIDNQEMGSREGSSSPSRRRRKMGRRSIENATTDVHDNANSSQQPPGPTAAVALSGVGAITAAASALAAGTIATSLPAGASLAGTSTSLAAPAVMSGAAISGTTTSTTKKTESLKAASQQSSDAMNTDNVQGSNLANIDAVSEHLHHHSTHHHHAGDIVDKSSNHKQQKQISKDASGSGGGPSSELVIEPKSEYDDEGNDEAVEDLTLDEEDMAIDDLDQNAGTSQGGEGSSHGYAPWQPDRSQNELLLETQEAQQRDPQDTIFSTQDDLNVSNASNNKMVAGNTAATSLTGSINSTQSESRIRVRNWIMLADQSVLEKTAANETSCESLTLNNNNNNNIEAGLTSITTNTATTNVATSTSCGSAGGSNSNQIAAPPLLQLKPKMTLDPNTQATMTRIGSIGRTTIACITPAGTGPVVGSHNGSVGMNTAAALAAAGVELDTVDDSMTEVIVKIENSASSINDEDEEAHEESEEPDDDDTELNYDIKLSSPMEWSLDAVKIEQEEEFEDILSAGQDLADEDLLTTAAASAKLAAESNDANNMPRKRRTLLMKKSSAMNSPAAAVTHIELQTPEQLLEQQQHLQNLQLKPNLPVQIKLHSIPATITTITPQMPRSTAPPLAPLTPKPLETPRNVSNMKSADYQSMLSKDKRYRILVQNQRMRKESLEHSQDMIYNADIEKPWVCRNCNRNYKWKNSLKCHLKNECGQPPRYFCSKLCGYATNVHSNLKRHLNTKCRDRNEEENATNQNLAQQSPQQQQQQQQQSSQQQQSQTQSQSQSQLMSRQSAAAVAAIVNDNNPTIVPSTTTTTMTSSSTGAIEQGSTSYTLVLQKSE